MTWIDTLCANRAIVQKVMAEDAKGELMESRWPLIPEEWIRKEQVRSTAMVDTPFGPCLLEQSLLRPLVRFAWPELIIEVNTETYEVAGQDVPSQWASDWVRHICSDDVHSVRKRAR